MRLFGWLRRKPKTQVKIRTCPMGSIVAIECAAEDMEEKIKAMIPELTEQLESGAGLLRLPPGFQIEGVYKRVDEEEPQND